MGSSIWPSSVRLLPSPSSVQTLTPPQYVPMKVVEQVIILFAGVRGYLDKVAIKYVGRFEAEFRATLPTVAPGLIDQVTEDKEITPATEEKLKELYSNFA